MKSFWFVLPGINPVPWTSPELAIAKKDGKPYPVAYAAEPMKDYKRAIADAMRRRYPDIDPIEDEVGLRLFFYRRIEELKRHGSRSSRSNFADATNLQKSTEDALQGVLFVNDSQVVNATSWVMAQHDGVEPCVIINLIWHPEYPALPDHVQAVIDAHPVLNKFDNTHRASAEEFFLPVQPSPKENR